MQYALASSLLAGTALSLIGIFILSTRVSFLGLAASQLAALGAVIGALLGFHYGEHGFALASVGAGLILLHQISKSPRVPQEIWIASLYIFGAAAAVLLLAKAPQGEAHTMDVFFGNVLSLGITEVWEGLSILLLTVLLLSGWFHRWIWIAFDPMAVNVAKINVDLWSLLFYTLFALSMTVAIHIFGVLLAFTYLLLPGAIALLLFRRIASIFIFIPAFVAGLTVSGFYGSFRLDYPTGPFIAFLLAAAALLCGIYRRWARPS